ncbi:late competence development ComFB family protein [Vibrio hepatarius]|uniref:late competence development ComFB family protein n=1 Tax=Vibrio hepatarius TaxID=171383 RepID=UPI00142E0496|nr:late competence development ComFB family protein [Vibrio hepatarius]NIY81879.1 late competence development ComFB family protein [Vibrio hepatarius]NVJ55211.1 late competence development ComFB family protein [Vibrionaceae bacterium]
MQISEDVHNYMETLVGQALAQPEFSDRFGDEQLADMACIALNQLKPVYIRHDVDFLSSLPESRLVALKNSALTALDVAKEMIINDSRSNRADVPAVFTKPEFDEDKELEWYETPIIPRTTKR